MSRNRATTRCACGYYSFAKETFPPGDPTLITFQQYGKLIGRDEAWVQSERMSDGTWGHGFDAARNGATLDYWTRSNGLGWTNSAAHVRETSDEAWQWVHDPCVYSEVPEDDRYRFRCARCPVCRRMYLVYYTLQPWLIRKPRNEPPDEPMYSAYDTSYWWSFNDEPSDDDMIGVLHWTPKHEQRALKEYVDLRCDLKNDIALLRVRDHEVDDHLIRALQLYADRHPELEDRRPDT